MIETMAETDDTYNGWSNRETWVVNLWLSNEEPLYLEAGQIVAQAIADGLEYEAEHGWEADENSGLGLAASRLQEFVELLVSDEYDKASMLTDLINTALARVDWLELAKAWRDSE